MFVCQFVIFIAIAQSIIFFGHWFLYKTIVFSFGLTDANSLTALRAVIGAGFLSFPILIFLALRYSNAVVRIFYLISASWMGFLNFLFLAAVSFWVVYFAVEKFSLPFDRRFVAAIFFAVAIVAGIYGIINANNLRIKNISVKLPNLPEYWKGKTAVWVSDIHLGPIRRFEFAQKIADEIQSQNPDLVFIGGDLFDGGVVDLDDFAVPFSKLKPTDGIYFVTGNHEEFSSSDAAYIDTVEKSGIKVLNGEMVNVKGLQIVGVGWNESENPKKYQAVLDKISLDKNLPSILLKHAPTNLRMASGKGFSFQISGHTHVGQIFPMNLIVKMIYRDYSYGLRKSDGMQVYTSSGAGTWGPPMRVGNYPEIVAIRIE